MIVRYYVGVSTMTNTNSAQPIDPLATIRAMRDATLDTWAKLAIDAVNTDLFAQILGMYLNTTLTSTAPIQRTLDHYMQALLPRLSMPSRSEITMIAQRLTNIELRLDDLDARLDDFHQPAAPALAVEERLKAIESRLDTLLAATQQPAATSNTPRPRRQPNKKREVQE
jgi:hypothetical protein